MRTRSSSPAFAPGSARRGRHAGSRERVGEADFQLGICRVGHHAECDGFVLVERAQRLMPPSPAPISSTSSPTRTRWRLRFGPSGVVEMTSTGRRSRRVRAKRALLVRLQQLGDDQDRADHHGRPSTPRPACRPRRTRRAACRRPTALVFAGSCSCLSVSARRSPAAASSWPRAASGRMAGDRSAAHAR